MVFKMLPGKSSIGLCVFKYLKIGIFYRQVFTKYPEEGIYRP